MVEQEKQTILITGSAGFIGYHLSKTLLDLGWIVIGLDSVTTYYDVKLKRCRLSILSKYNTFTFYEKKLEDMSTLNKIFNKHNPLLVVHLAAQAGVRNSIDNPKDYLDSNLIGTFNILEVTRNFGCNHLLLASTSSVYGANKEIPSKETFYADTQMSFYAATKKANEVMSHSYSHLFNIPTTCFRFFTVYGPWGRPDMALFKFVEAILAGKPIDVYNHGNMYRDFTYIDDLIEGIRLLIDTPPVTNSNIRMPISDDTLSPVAPWRCVNIGNNNPVKLFDFINEIETCLDTTAKKNLMDIQAGDVPKTYADTQLLFELTGFKPKTSIKVGVQKFVAWYLKYYHDQNQKQP